MICTRFNKYLCNGLNYSVGYQIGSFQHIFINCFIECNVFLWNKNFVALLVETMKWVIFQVRMVSQQEMLSCLLELTACHTERQIVGEMQNLIWQISDQTTIFRFLILNLLRVTLFLLLNWCCMGETFTRLVAGINAITVYFYRK